MNMCSVSYCVRSPVVATAVSIAMLLLVQGSPARAEFSTLLSFEAPQGDRISGLLFANDGCLYLTVAAGGSANLGAIVKRDRTGRITVLHSFDGSDGSVPAAALVEGSDGYFYGTTSSGGASNYGTAFRISASGAFTTLHSFTLEDGGPSRAALLLASDGQLYGVNAGVYLTSPPALQALSHGTVFRLGTDGKLTTLHRFDGSDGSKPLAQLVEASDGNLYGTTSLLQDSVAAHPWNLTWGTVFRIGLDGSFSSLHTFDGNDGANPLGQLLEAADGSLYGTTFGGTQWQGHPSSAGSIFRITPAGSFEDLHAFGDDEIGNSPNAGLVDGGDGNFYGATTGGGQNGFGSFFRFTPPGSLTALHQFSALDTAPTRTPFVEASQGGWYGATATTLFQINARGRLRTLNRLGFQRGAQPSSGLLLARDGYYYGATDRGGTYDNGSIYRWRPGSDLKVIYSFAGAPAYNQSQFPSDLIQGSDGALYGTSWGNTGFGIIFRVTTNGSFSTLYSFQENGVSYPGNLIQASDGKLYGTASVGGPNGVAYSFDLRSRALTVLHAYGADGDTSGFPAPWGALVEHPDGNFYGVAQYGGDNQFYGTYYRLSKSGQFTLLYSFSGGGAEGTGPIALVLNPQGKFYGVSSSGGLGGGGALFEVDTAASFTPLRGFVSDDPNTGSDPVIPLLLGADRQLYGANARGGPNGAGTIFKLDAAGELTTVYGFPLDPNASFPIPSPLVQGADGKIYGTSPTGGASHAGAIFSVTP